MEMTSKLPVLACLLLVAGCDDFRMEEEALTARAAGLAPGRTVPGPDCASCHAYPLADTNHAFHLLHTSEVKAVNGPVTCFDCHSTAIASRPFTLHDTVFVDSLGNEWHTSDFPVDPARPSLADTLRTFRRDRVETVVQERPVPAPIRPGRPPAWEEYVTALAHMNGKVDVVFAGRVSDPSKWNGARAEYNPEKETCSAVACHPGQHPGGSPHWRFAAPGKGLPELLGREGDVP